MKLFVPPLLKKLAFQAACPIYIVGGYIRNSLLGLPKSDIDICGPLLPDKLNISADIIPVNKRLGTALITDGKESYEYTPLRTESYGEGGEHSPLSVCFGASIEEDARRRDFTAGSVYYDIKADEFIDPFGGIEDIRKRVLRCAYPDFTLTDDGLRLMRLCRIAAETGFDIEETTFLSAIKNRERLRDISPERKREELEKILSADLKYGIKDAHYRGVTLLYKLKLWEFVIKEVADMDGVPQNPKYHKYDVLGHSLMAVKYAHPSVRLAALLHDVGKPVCLYRDGNMYMHNTVGAEMVCKILGQEGLRYPAKTIRFVSELVKNHMYDMNGMTKLNKVKIFLASHAHLMPQLVYLIEADGMATGMMDDKHVAPHRFTVVFNELLKSKAPLKLSDLAIDGNDVAAAGLTGKSINDMLVLLKNECVIDPSLNRRDILLEKISKLKSRV